MAPIDVNAVLANMKTLLRHTIGRGIAIETRLDPAAANAVCDANQLENALLNLAINARDAMPEGGKIVIATARVRVETEAELPPGNYVCVSVTDTGEGMTPDVLGRATEPFFSTKPLGKGTGLGLAQVYGIARQAGGTIRIESEPGKGTTVRLLIPAAEAELVASVEEPSGPATEPLHPRSGRASILVVDDDHEVRAFIAVSLESLGYSVVEAERGADALARLGESIPDLVLMDFAMPEMNGAEVASAVREQHPGLPIMFVTGYAESEQLEAALGIDVPVLRKPFTVAQLAAAVEEQLAIR